MIDERIKRAANELASALTEGGKDYSVQADRVDVTQIQDRDQRFVYTLHVVEHSERRLAP